MKHLSEATLALYAGRDLGWFARWRAERHLAHCERCRSEVEAFSDLRAELTELNELPGIAWNRVAAEMKANIRLGLAAGECVRERETAARPEPRLFTGPRSLVACGSVAALLVTGLLLERPSPPARAEGVVLQATSNAIELQEGGQVLSLLHNRAQNVMYSAGAQGSMRARYVDADTGYVTINNVYVQ